MNPSFPQAALPDTYRVARFRVQTLCLGHALLLQRLDSPYGVRPGDAQVGAQLGDIALAVWACRRAPGSALARLQRTRSPRDLGWIAWRIKRYGLERAQAELLAYLGAHWPQMSWWKNQNVATRQLGADFMHRVVLTQRRLGLSLQGAMDVPLAVALWDVAAVAEESGAVSLVSDRDRALMAHYEAMEAAGMFPHQRN